MRTRMFTSLLGFVCASAMPLSTGLAQDRGHPFQLSSSTFDNNTFLPISAIFNVPENGKNLGQGPDATRGVSS